MASSFHMPTLFWAHRFPFIPLPPFPDLLILTVVITDLYQDSEGQNMMGNGTNQWKFEWQFLGTMYLLPFTVLFWSGIVCQCFTAWSCRSRFCLNDWVLYNDLMIVKKNCIIKYHFFIFRIKNKENEKQICILKNSKVSAIEFDDFGFLIHAFSMQNRNSWVNKKKSAFLNFFFYKSHKNKKFNHCTFYTKYNVCPEKNWLKAF